MLKKWLHNIGMTIIKIFSGDIILEKKWDRYLPFVFYLFVLVCGFIVWNLYVESKLVEAKKNEYKIEEMVIANHQSSLDLAALNERSKVERLLLANGSTLHAPTVPPVLIKLEETK
ncbi:MAG: FtsL-like putative cell division protein [Bacteroidales bacterium]|nr:FtsL-like putative cell division protein [Bacteroidales bacterium]